MGKVVFNMTISLDGFVAGPNDGPENGMGDGGDQIFEWYFTGNTEVPISDGQMVLKVSAQSAELMRVAFARYGAGVWGRRTFDIAHAWNGHPPGTPCLVVTHSAPPEWLKEGSPFIFVTDGVESAIRQAKGLAGDKEVVLCTASVFQQALTAGLVDEIHLDVAPVLLGRGVRLFEHLRIEPMRLERLHAIAAPGVTHLAFRILNSPYASKQA
ncbi:MAG: dihydrofolate reductase family protein [Anaerolineales bacterium]|nr:dihydrofolate reductase family protein [Anaerolineales bacterium]